MNGETIQKAFQDAGITDAISCADAWAVAEKLNIPKERDRQVLFGTRD